MLNERVPGIRLALALGVAFLLCIPLFSVWLLVYDRQSQFRQATASITQGWGSEQVIRTPVLAIPYRAQRAERPSATAQQLARASDGPRELTLQPEALQLATAISPEVRKRSIYEAIVYRAQVDGKLRFALPSDLASSGVDISALDLGRAELRFGISDPRGLGGDARVTLNRQPLRLRPGLGSTGGAGFFASIDGKRLASAPILIDFRFELRGTGSLSLVPDAGDTSWDVRSSWTSPSFGGEFLPTSRQLAPSGFTANYRIGNLALGRALVSPGDNAGRTGAASPAADPKALVSLVQPVDSYAQVNRATKYGFLLIGFTFLGLLMFDVVGGISVSSVEYLLMGAALVLFFVLLLAFAEVIGFTGAYVLAASAIAVLDTCYSAAVLGSWRRAVLIGCVLVCLYGILFVLLALEAYALVIGSLLLFAALASVMYATRHIDWSGEENAANRTG